MNCCYRQSFCTCCRKKLVWSSFSSFTYTLPPFLFRGFHYSSPQFLQQYQQQQQQQQHEEEEEEELRGNHGKFNHSYLKQKICRLCRSGSVDEALALVSRLHYSASSPVFFRSDTLVLTHILHSLCDASRYAEACHRLLLHLSSSRAADTLDERSCNILLARLAVSANYLSLVLSVFSALLSAKPHFVPSLVNHNRIIHLLCLSGRITEAVNLLFDMKMRGLTPNVVTYTALIQGLCVTGNIVSARQLFDEMLGRKIQPNSLTLSVLLRGILRTEHGGLDAVRELVYQMWDRMDAEGDDRGLSCFSMITPNVAAAFTNFIDGLCREGFFHEVFRIAGEMPSRGKNLNQVFAYNQMIDSLCRAKHNHGAARIVYIMRKRNFVPSNVSYNFIIHGLCKQQGNCKRAFQLFNEGSECGYVPSEQTYKVLVEGLCREFDVSKAKEVLKYMLEKSSNASKLRVYNIFLKGVCLLKNPSELLNTMVLMMENGCKPDVVTLNILIDGLSEAGSMDEAMKILSDMLSGSLADPDVITFTTLLGGLADLGRINEAINLLESMPERGCSPTVVTYNSVMKGLRKYKKIDDLLMFFHEMSDNGVCPDSQTFVMLIDGLFESGRLDDVKKLWEEQIWVSKHHDDFVYVALLRGLCDSGKLDKACNFLHELVGSGVAPKVIFYNVLIDNACKLLLKKEAYRIMAEMKRNRVSPDSVTWRTLNKLHHKSKSRSCECLVTNIELRSNLKHDNDIEQLVAKGKDQMENLLRTETVRADQLDEQKKQHSSEPESTRVTPEVVNEASDFREPLFSFAKRLFGLF